MLPCRRHHYLLYGKSDDTVVKVEPELQLGGHTVAGLSFTKCGEKKVVWPTCLHSFVTGCSVRVRYHLLRGDQITQ